MDDKKTIAVIKKVMPAVVSIMIAKRLEDLEKELPAELCPEVPGTHHSRAHSNSRNIPKIKIPKIFADNRGMVNIGGGSGFLVDSSGIILTNKHVLDDPKAEYTVILDDGQKYPAKILSRDPINDVAIVKVSTEIKKLPTIKLGDAAKLELGQGVIAIGNALGIFKNTVSVGIVSGLSRSISAQSDPAAPFQEMRGLIQTDAAINAGNSGGPLVDQNGLAIGINTAVVFGAQNIGFAIPINAAKRDLQDISKYGRIRRPLLGIRYFIIDDNLKDKMHLPVNYGALIARESPNDYGIVPGSPAEKAGLREKDIVLEFNSQKINRGRPVQDFLDNMSPGEEAELLVLRGQKQFRVKLTLAERK